jgi:hypothetical protein
MPGIPNPDLRILSSSGFRADPNSQHKLHCRVVCLVRRTQTSKLLQHTWQISYICTGNDLSPASKEREFNIKPYFQQNCQTSEGDKVCQQVRAQGGFPPTC